MKLITTAMRVGDVADRWEKQYFRDGAWRRTGPIGAPLSSERTQRIASELRALPKGAGAAEVAAIIGNVSWTRLKCDECRTDVGSYVVVGESALCSACLAKAAALAE